MVVEIGKQAPNFTLPNQSGKEISLSDFKGKNVVLYFYPKDMTPGCTTQACDFRDNYESFEQADTVILGVSPDPIERHQKFIDKHDLPFELLADEDHQVAKQYGVWKLKKMFGKEFYGIERSTFIIDKEGILQKDYRKVRVKGHVEEVLADVKENK
ncbi:MAG TPA: thioredoxin-dependent thiol peroxidase [Bacillota bacterium]